MEELFVCLDDTLFETTAKVRSKDSETYRAKQCEPLWFAGAPCGRHDDKKRAKSAADWHYRRREFSPALALYRQARDLSRHPSRELQESIVRCLTRLNRREECLQELESLHSDTWSVDQMTAYLNLASFVYTQFGDTAGALDVQQKQCLLQPSEPLLWLRLAGGYRALASNSETAAFQTRSEENSDASLPQKLSHFTLDSTTGENAVVQQSQTHSYMYIDAVMHSCKYPSATTHADFINTCKCTHSGQGLTKETEIGEDQHASQKPTSNNATSNACVFHLRLKELTCLHRALYLVRIVERHARSFAATRNEQLVTQICEQIKTIPIEEELKNRCCKEVQTASETEFSEESERDEKIILARLHDSATVFHTKWFSWFT